MTDQTDASSLILAEYADGPTLLDTVVGALTESDLDLAPGNDAWSIRQIVHHLADGDDLWKVCIKAALGNSDGQFTLQWYWEKPQTDWSRNWKYTNRAIESSLALLRANRRHIIELVQQTAGAMKKSIWLMRPDGQKERVTVGWIIEMQTGHVVDHVKDIQKILQKHQGKSSS